MAGFQPAQRRLDDDADIDDWMAQRNADLRQLGPDAAAAGREAWSQSTRTGENLSAGQRGDVIAMGAQALNQYRYPTTEGSESGSLDDEIPLPLATVEPAITPVALPDADNLTSFPDAFRSASRFATARQGDSISRLLGTSDPAAVGKFLTLNGLDGRDSTLFAGQSYAIPRESDDASPDELAAGQRLLRTDNAKLAEAADRRASTQASDHLAPAAPLGSITTASPAQGGAIHYGALRADLPSDQELAELRRQQAAFSKTTRQIDIQNSGFAIPALAPPLIALGLGGAAAWGAGGLGPEAEGVLDFLESDPYLRVGDNWATRAGRRAHAALREWVAQKPGWEPEPNVKLPDGRLVKPDVRTPPRVRNPGEDPKPFQMELKPNTPSGRRAAARAVRQYQDLTDVKTRPIFYDPKPFI
jgi:hypothetical protein